MTFGKKGKLLFLLLLAGSVHAQTEGRIENGNAEIYYRTWGKGVSVLIINGGPGMNSDGFATLAKKLSDKNQTIIYDQRGTGRSIVQPVSAETITMDAMVSDMEALRKHLGIEQWTLLGHSFGGMLACYYTSKYPQYVRSLILSSSGGIDLGLLSYAGSSIQSKLTPLEKDSLNYWNKKIENGDTSYFARLHRGLALAPAYVFEKKNVPVIAERLTQGNNQVLGLVWDDLDKIHYDCAPQLKKFDKPVLIIQGREDIIEKKTAEKAHEVLRNSKIVFMDHCVHYGWLDNPEVYFSEINRFLLIEANRQIP